MQNLHTGGTAGGLIITAIRRHGDRLAIADDNVSWTYRELGNAIGRCIKVFKDLSLKKGDALSILSSNRAESWAAMCAALIIGMRYTPLHPLAAEDDHAFIVEDAEIDVLIVEGAKFGDRAEALKRRVPALKHLLSFGPAAGCHDMLAAMQAASPTPLADDGEAEAIAWLAYTGGTTGRSKGVMIPHRALATMTTVICADWDWPRDIRYLAVTPISHAAGVTMFPVMVRGGYTRLAQGFDMEAFCKIVSREQINATFLVPTLIYRLIDEVAVREQYDLSSLDLVVYGAAPMSPDRLLEGMRIFGKVFLQLYGQTEAPQCVTCLRKVDHDPSRPQLLGSCGLPNPLVEVRLFDREMREVKLGEPGEICVRGSLVMQGYWKRPDATEEAFRGGWLHTGDVAIQDAEGYLYIVDRTKDMIISGGFNIYPREVEDALMSHPSVASAAVIGVPDPKWGEAVMAFVVLKEGVRADEAELQAHVKEKRGGPWSPKSINFVSSIPVTGLGKVDRKALRAPYWGGHNRAVA